MPLPAAASPDLWRRVVTVVTKFKGMSLLKRSA